MIPIKKLTKAMILAAGEGTRLRPLTLYTPKALLPIGGVPLLLHTLGWLREHGVSEVAINTHYLGEAISQRVGDGSSLGLAVHYSPEEVLLGTAGAVKRLEDFFDSWFVVVYGDVLTDCDLAALANYHRRRGAIATLALTQVADPTTAGVVRLSEDGRVIGFVEKPSPGIAAGNLANGGIYILERQVLDYIPDGVFCDFGFHVFPRILEEGLPVYGYPLPPETYLIDIGSPDKFRRANEDVTAGRVRLSISNAAKAR